MEYQHRSVLLKETIDALNVKAGEKYIDATLGGGGHASEIIKRGGIVLGIDIDQVAIDHVREILKTEKNLFVVKGNFKNIKEIAVEYGFTKVAGILFDLGMSAYQIKQSGRGFSFERDEYLDMRMDKTQDLTAAELLNRSTEEELNEIFAKYAEELDTRTISRAIVRARTLSPIRTSRELVRVMNSSGHEAKEDRGRRARVFQALRIVVNQEIDSLKTGIDAAIILLQQGGRIAVISFHSLEDRIVKLRFREGDVRLINKKPIVASLGELHANKAARSAKLRIAEKI